MWQEVLRCDLLHIARVIVTCTCAREQTVCECACERVLDSHTSQCKGFMYYAGRGSDFIIVSCFIRVDFRFEPFVEFSVKCC